MNNNSTGHSVNHIAVVLAFTLPFLLTTPQVSAMDFPIFSDRTAELLQDLPNDNSVKTLGVADFNNDGFDDIVVARRGLNPRLLMNEQGVLTNRTSTLFANPASSRNSTYVETFDANADGFIDLVFAVLDQPVRLHLNLGMNNGVWLGFNAGENLLSGFNALTIESGDINGDGTADDLFINQVLDENVLLINEGSGTFRDASNQLDTLQDTLNNGHFGLVDDVNADGVDDIMYILADDNLFVYYNDGRGNFSGTRRSSFQNTHFGQPLAYTCGCADFNGDGIFDYAVHADGGGDDRLTSFMSTGVIGNNGIPEYVFVDQPGVPGRMSRRHGLPDVGDLDGDGDLDYVQSSLERVHGTLALRPIGVRTLAVINTGDNSGIFDAYVGEDWGKEDSHDVKLIDINNDGNLDMFIGHDTRYGVYINAAEPSTIELNDVITTTPAEVGFSASLEVSLLSGTNATYVWDFGDGNTLITDVPRAEHVFSQPGHYAVTVTVTGVEGSDQVNFKQTVFSTLTAQQPTSSSGMQYEADNTRGPVVYVVATDHDHVTAINPSNNTVISEIAVGDEPHSMALGTAGTLYVVNKNDASISIIDTELLRSVDEVLLPYASRPHGIVVDRLNEFAYVALEASNQIIKLELPSLNRVATVNTGPVPRELSLTGDGSTLYAPRFITPPLLGEDTRNVSLAGNAEALQINTTTMTITGQINFPVNDISETEEDDGTTSRGIPNYLRAPVISPDGQSVIIPAKLDNIFRGSMRDGKARAHDKLVRGVFLKFDTQTNQEITAQRFDFDNNSAPTAVAYDPTGSYLFVIHEGSRAFEVMDAYSNTILFRTTAEFAPRNLLISPDGDLVYIHNYLSRSVSVYNTAEIIANQGGTANLETTINIVSDERLSPTVLLGKQLFHDSEDNRLTTQGYIACASCHDDAGHDGRTWDFSDAGEGLRNTIDLRGRAGIGDGNVHWSANFDEFHDFENDIREIFAGTGLLTDQDFAASAAPLNDAAPKAGRSAALDALAAYGASLTEHYDSPYRNPDGSLTANARTGRQIFIDTNCAACHSGTGFTNSPSATGHNIGTVDNDTGGRLGKALLNGGLDTPTLRGLWQGAPYLHDGSAATLTEAVLAHSRVSDIATAQLSESELDSLQAYLLQIDHHEIEAPERVPPTNSSAPSNPLFADGSNRITIDGDLSEWANIDSYANDPDDVSGDNNPLDFASTTLAHNNTHLFVQYHIHAPNAALATWGLSLQLDTDANASTGFKGFSGELPIGVDYMIEGNSLHRYTGDGNNFSWSDGVELPFATSGTGIELAVPRSLISSSTLLNFFLYANNESVGGTAVDFYPDSVANIEATSRHFAYSLEPNTTSPEAPSNGANIISNPTNPLNINGDLAEWNTFTSFGIDSNDTNESIDWVEAWVAHDSDSLYVAWTNDEVTQLTWGNGVMFDVDRDSTTGFRGYNNEMPIGIDLLLEAGQLHRYTGNGNDWNWSNTGTARISIADNRVELSIPRTILGDSMSFDLFFVGKNEAIGGSYVDFYPDGAGNIHAPISNRHFTYALEPVVAAALPQQIRPTSGSTGFIGIAALFMLLVTRLRHSLLTLLKNAARSKALKLSALAMTFMISACGESGVKVGQQIENSDQPKNNPSIGLIQASDPAENNASFVFALPALSLLGTQAIPAVATRAQGTALLSLNHLSGQLSGKLTHSVDMATGATINIGALGELGDVVVNLEPVDEFSFQVPAGTILSEQDIARFTQGDMYIVIQSNTYSQGEIRAQISQAAPALTLEPTLDSLQATVFTPTCSGCHNGTGITAPGAMNLTSAESSFDALVNTPSIQVPNTLRVSINDSSSSYLIQKLTGTQSIGSQMPFRGVPLDAPVIEAIRQWIDTGANR